MRRVAVIASASGNGKTTLGRALAARLGVPYVELDALVHGPYWQETPDDELRAQLEPTLRSDGWVIDGTYQRKLGTLVLDLADTVVWLDLPLHVWLPRLAAADRPPAHGPRAAVERQPRNAPRRLLGSRIAVRVCARVALPAAPLVAGRAGRAAGRAPSQHPRGRALVGDGVA